MTGLVGIAIANYNKADYLPECLNSILSQSFTPTSIVVLDDCSSDDSVEIVDAYSRKYTHIHCIRSSQNTGVSLARERAIAALDTTYIMTLDSDDYLVDPRKIEVELDVLQQQGNHNDISFSDVLHVDTKGIEFRNPYRCRNIREGQIFEELSTLSCFVPRDFLYPKRLHLAAGGYDPRFSVYEDWDLKLRLSKIAKFRYSGLVGVAYRQHKSGLSYVSRKDHLNWLVEVFRKNSEGHPQQERLLGVLLKNERTNHLNNYRNRLRRVLSGEVSLTDAIRDRLRNKRT